MTLPAATNPMRTDAASASPRTGLKCSMISPRKCRSGAGSGLYSTLTRFRGKLLSGPPCGGPLRGSALRLVVAERRALVVPAVGDAADVRHGLHVVSLAAQLRDL